MLTATPPPEAPPTPPPQPDPNACCQSGCPICVFDLYQDELDEYRRALAAWHLRHDAATGAAAAKTPPTRP